MSTLWLCWKSGTRLSGVLLEDRVQCLDEQIGIGFSENQRWTQLDDIVMRPMGPGQNAPLAQPVHDVVRFCSRGIARRTVANKVNPEEKPGAPDVANERTTLLQH